MSMISKLLYLTFGSYAVAVGIALSIVLFSIIMFLIVENL